MLDKSRDPESDVPILPRLISRRDKAEDRQANYRESIRQSAASIFTIVSNQVSFYSLTNLLRHTNSGSHAEPRIPNLLPAMPGTHLPRDPIPIRQHVHRQSVSLPGLRRENPPAARVRNGVPGLLTRIADMWLMDLREPQKESRHGPIGDQRSKRVSSKRSVIHKTRTRGPVNVKTR